MYQSKGLIKIKELNQKLYISKSPFEKRFRKIVGTSPKKFTSIVRFNSVLNQLASNGNLRVGNCIKAGLNLVEIIQGIRE